MITMSIKRCDGSMTTVAFKRDLCYARAKCLETDSFGSEKKLHQCSSVASPGTVSQNQVFRNIRNLRFSEIEDPVYSHRIVSWLTNASKVAAAYAGRIFLGFRQQRFLSNLGEEKDY